MGLLCITVMAEIRYTPIARALVELLAMDWAGISNL